MFTRGAAVSICQPVAPHSRHGELEVVTAETHIWPEPAHNRTWRQAGILRYCVLKFWNFYYVSTVIEGRVFVEWT